MSTMTVCEITITGSGKRWSFTVSLPDGGDLLESGLTSVSGVAKSRKEAHDAVAWWAGQIEEPNENGPLAEGAKGPSR